MYLNFIFQFETISAIIYISTHKPTQLEFPGIYMCY